VRNKEGLLFLKKKKQKDFAPAGAGTELPIIATVGGDYRHFRSPRPQEQSFFGYFFFKKSNFFHLLTLFPFACHAAGIDCRLATSPIDRAICASPALLAQDKILNARTQAVSAAVGQSDASADAAAQFSAQARTWLKDRNTACAHPSAPCLLQAYGTRNLFLQILLDRVAGSALPLMNVSAAQLQGTWVAGTVTMLSAADNRLGYQNVFPLYIDTSYRPLPTNNFTYENYQQNNLPMPGAKITNQADTTCFTGGAFTPPGSGVSENNDLCNKFAWQPTDFQHLWTDMNGSHSQSANPQSDTENFQIPPALIERDLGLTPTSPVYIGYLAIDNSIGPQAELFIVQGKDGALYAPVTVLSTDPTVKGFNVAYQKWTPASQGAEMKDLTPGK